MRFLVISLLCLWSALSVSAQEEAPPPRTLRLLAVGDSPPFRQEIRDGVRHELPPPEGSVPPNRVVISVLDTEGAEKSGEYEVNNPEEPGLRLRLNGVSNRMTVPGSELAVRMQVGESTWHSFKLPEGGDYLAIIWRDPEVKNWSKARSILVKDGGSAFKAGDFRFINVGPVDVGFVIGDGEQFTVSRGKTVVKPLGVSQGTPTKALYRDRGGWKRLWSSALVQNRGERSTVVVYFADGEKPRRPLKLVALRERAVALAKPKPRPEPTNR